MFTYNINYITGFLCIPPLSIFLFLDGVQDTMLHLVLMCPDSSLIYESFCLS